MRVGILEDDRALADQVGAALAGAGHSYRWFDRGEAILAALARETFDLLLVDWNLPDISGLEVVSRLRARANCATLPVIFLTSRTEGADIVQALNAGADDYIVKPFKADELLARVAALLRRSFPTNVNEQLTVGKFHFDIARARLTLSGEPVAVTNKEFQLALLMLSNPNRILSRAYLMEAIWNTRHDLQTRTLDVHMSRVRTKLGLRPEMGYRLVSLQNHGYRLETMADASKPSEGDHA